MGTDWRKFGLSISWISGRIDTTPTFLHYPGAHLLRLSFRYLIAQDPEVALFTGVGKSFVGRAYILTGDTKSDTGVVFGVAIRFK
jgi:hypothetical protein